MKTFRDLFIRALKVGGPQRPERWPRGPHGAGRAGVGRRLGPGVTGAVSAPHRRTRTGRSRPRRRRRGGCGARTGSQVRPGPAGAAAVGVLCAWPLPSLLRASQGRRSGRRWAPGTPQAASLSVAGASQSGRVAGRRRKCVSSTPCWPTSGGASSCGRQPVAEGTRKVAAGWWPQTPQGTRLLVRLTHLLASVFPPSPPCAALVPGTCLPPGSPP